MKCIRSLLIVSLSSKNLLSSTQFYLLSKEYLLTKLLYNVSNLEDSNLKTGSPCYITNNKEHKSQILSILYSSIKWSKWLKIANKLSLCQKTFYESLLFLAYIVECISWTYLLKLIFRMKKCKLPFIELSVFINILCLMSLNFIWTHTTKKLQKWRNMKN